MKNFGERTFRKENSFRCGHCGKMMVVNEWMGTSYRNHCPFCLWSKHVDEKRSGDKMSRCLGSMRPVGLTFKHAGVDKYGKARQGELMLVHICDKCERVNINRIAADDSEEEILKIWKEKEKIEEDILEKIAAEGVDLLEEKDEKEIKKQLFGATSLK